jgi:hypothetical protein
MEMATSGRTPMIFEATERARHGDPEYDVCHRQTTYFSQDCRVWPCAALRLRTHDCRETFEAIFLEHRPLRKRNRSVILPECEVSLNLGRQR